MNCATPEEIQPFLRQVRTLLVTTVLMLVCSNVIDPPFSTFGTLLNILVLVVLVFVLFRIHRSLIATASSTKST